MVTTSGTGHAIVDKVLAQKGYRRSVVMKVPSFLAVARIVAQTELLLIVPRVRMFEPPVSLPLFAIKQHWHERFHAKAGNAWLRKMLAELLGR